MNQGHKVNPNLIEVFKDELLVDGVPRSGLHPLGVAEEREEVGSLLLRQRLDLTRLEAHGTHRAGVGERRGPFHEHRL